MAPLTQRTAPDTQAPSGVPTPEMQRIPDWTKRDTGQSVRLKWAGCMDEQTWTVLFFWPRGALVGGHCVFRQLLKAARALRRRVPASSATSLTAGAALSWTMV